MKLHILTTLLLSGLLVLACTKKADITTEPTIDNPPVEIKKGTINGTLTHGGINREYILYVPEIYDGEKDVPLVFNFHGYGSDNKAQMGYGDFRPISDTANFIIVHPLGTLLPGQDKTHFNVGGWTLASTTDDVGFTSALIDHLAEAYKIDLSRVYSTGMSNGGYMSFLLACQLSDKIAAVASVTGSMSPQMFQACDPKHPMPIVQIHGTNDNVVPYGGNPTWTKSIDEVLNYWIDHNNCNATPHAVTIPDLDPNDNGLADRIIYEGGDKNAAVIHYKVDKGGHTWPGNPSKNLQTNNDFNASLYIWQFFAKYDLDDLKN